MMFPDDLQIEQIANELATYGLCVVQSCISAELIDSLVELAFQFKEQEQFRQAGIGASGDFKLERSVRGDLIRWILPQPEELPLQQWLQSIKSLREGINRTLYFGLRDQELHLAIYPPGTFYKRHLDQFQDRNNRLLSVILYLNKEWRPGDGGELVIYPEDSMPIIVEPRAGTFVCFLSESLEHEVLLTNNERISITGWLLKKPVGLGFLG